MGTQWIWIKNKFIDVPFLNKLGPQKGCSKCRIMRNISLFNIKDKTAAKYSTQAHYFNLYIMDVTKRNNETKMVENSTYVIYYDNTKIC